MRRTLLALAVVLIASCSDDSDPGGTTTATGSGSGVAGAAGDGGGGAGGGGMGGAGDGGDSGGSGGAGIGGGGAGGGATGGGGGVPTGPSCASLPATCGPNEDEGCCASATVPGGTYLRSYDGVSFLDNGNPATVSTFVLDRFEVTVGRFRAFVDDGRGVQASPPNDGDGAHPAIANSGWNSVWNGELETDSPALRLALSCSAAIPVWTSAAGPNETLPLNCVTWYEAAAFCAWDGGRLPTEAEWNYAAAGGDQQRAYPWSSPPSSTTIDATYAAYDCTADGSAAGVCALTDVQTVGSRSPLGDGRWGHADLGGNMWEWALDFSNSSYVNPCVDCADLSPDNARRIRGGSYFNPALGLRTATRAENDSDYRIQHAGLRCARNP